MDFEQLGAFYLGRPVDPDTGAERPEPLLYDSRNLTTHAVCVGMTGSGKTGLCLSLLEEAAIDGVPAIAIDPKGDLGNLCLTFPDLRPEDFLPWIDPEEAARKGRTPEEHARATAALWRRGLAEWGQDGSRIRRLREAADIAIYTPGSSAGLELSVLESFAAPPPAVAADPDALRERILGAVSGLLALLGIDADPLRSREHILLSRLLAHAWTAGRSLALPELIRGIQAPPFETVGVFDLETFYPARERTELAMTLNNLVAAPGFEAWIRGEPLDVDRLLHAPDGRPRVSILTLSHLGDAERMFFVTVLLNEVVSWMRAQPGTSSLRAILYMDEVFGYFPPSAAPPSKRPLLTLMKQARAHGLGVVLATQNPVDLDYKGLSNAGTWMLGRLQTERDKARVIEGLEGAAAVTGAALDRARMDRILSGLRSRVFLLHDVHEDGPELFHTRWALSYLRGPLTRDQIARLMEPRKATAARRGSPAPPPATPATGRAMAGAQEPAPAAGRPVLPAGIEERFLPVDELREHGRIVYRPHLLASATLHYAHARAEVDLWREVHLLAPVAERARAVPWKRARELPEAPRLSEEPPAGAALASLPAAAARPASYRTWRRQLASHLYRERPLVLWRCRRLELISEPDEAAGAFRGRVAAALREERDRAVAKLRERYRRRLERAQDRIASLERRIGREQEQVAHARTSTGIALGAALLSFFTGRRGSGLGRVATAARAASRSVQQRGDVARAREQLEEARKRLEALVAELEEKLDTLRQRLRPEDLAIDEIRIRPRKADLDVEGPVLLWAPFRLDADGLAEPAWPGASGDAPDFGVA